MADAETPDPIYWFSARFRLVGFDCDPKIITEHLGLDPTRALRKGELRRPGARAKYNVWIF